MPEEGCGHDEAQYPTEAAARQKAKADREMNGTGAHRGSDKMTTTFAGPLRAMRELAQKVLRDGPSLHASKSSELLNFHTFFLWITDSRMSSCLTANLPDFQRP